MGALAIATVGVAALAAGDLVPSAPLGVLGAVGIVAALQLWRWHARPSKRSAAAAQPQPPAKAAGAPAVPSLEKAVDLVDTMLAQGRHALLVRRQLVGNLSPAQLALAIDEMSEGMALVPAGDVMVSGFGAALATDEDHPLRTRVVGVESFYLDRCAVTNERFHQFLSAGGYEQMSLWEPEIWPAVLDFVDRTGHPGPRWWSNGNYPANQGDHPVVGISWYEAAAYARWIGKRLPTDAEWVKAASWPVTLPDRSRVQRRYPWGDTMDRKRANLWGSGPGGTVPVHEFRSGSSISGVYQLIGNVWEWTAGEVDWGNAEALPLVDGEPRTATLKSLHGGAFNTYFDAQATCQFQSGDHPLARKHNVGFRCAISMCDVALNLSGGAEPHSDSVQELVPVEAVR